MTAIHTRCRPGDIALVTNEEPGCEDNIGRTVIVQNKFVVDPELGLMWEIATVTDVPWVALRNMGRGGGLRHYQICQTHSDRSIVYQADKWLMPVRDPEFDGGGITLHLEDSPTQAPKPDRKKTNQSRSPKAPSKSTRRSTHRGGVSDAM